MNVLVIGGTGYIGSHTVEELLRRGHQVSVFSRGRLRPQLPAGVARIAGDRRNPEDLAHLASLGFDGVIDINAYTREETQSVIQAFDKTLSRFVHLSTLSVYQFHSPMPLKEDAPLETDPAATYGYNKAECERALRWAHAKSGFPFVSIRPAVVFGPRDDKSRENYYLKRLTDGYPIIIAGSGALPIFSTYVKDLAAALATALTADDCQGNAYNVLQSESVSIQDHVQAIARLAEVEADIAEIPSRLLERLGFSLQQIPYYSGDRLVAVDTSAARKDLGLAPTAYGRALKETVEYFLDYGPQNHPSIEDRFPPVMPRSRERALVMKYREAVRAMEDHLTDEWLNEALPEL